jgi:hypothetical protein
MSKQLIIGVLEQWRFVRALKHPPPTCHVERSETSRFVFGSDPEIEKFFASLRMTTTLSA